MNLLEKVVEPKTVETHLERLADIAFAEPEPERRAQSLPSEDEPLCIEFTDLWFRYSEDEPWTLRGASAAIEANSATAIIGPSGGGKSTLLKLLRGLLESTHGSITVNGTPLSDALQSYRQLTASVNQGEDLFMGTIAENIAFFEAPVDFERVQNAARQACIDADILALPMRYNTLITDGGANLSTGQIQRVLLARALSREPQLLFLDEATSHLDRSTEDSIVNVVRRLPMTRVIVAHRSETISACDHILALEDGVLHQVSHAARRT